ncbi:hypothetical protein LTR97_001850 [Elasticomyces elasticus]|uniref:Uncharacterized protein n=1 Tax=Elasticomyces elasticus TaxID=574655 RepID=A0AAN7VWR5_9PEZI|nr:hypothetical protein LTR97_001850 [Elasticomyces elasticus]
MSQSYNTPGDGTYLTNNQHHFRQPGYAGPDNTCSAPAEPLGYGNPGHLPAFDDDSDDDFDDETPAKLQKKYLAAQKKCLIAQDQAIGTMVQNTYAIMRLNRAAMDLSLAAPSVARGIPPYGRDERVGRRPGNSGPQAGGLRRHSADIMGHNMMPPPSQADPVTQGVPDPEPSNLPAPGHPGAAPEAHVGGNQTPYQPAPAIGQTNVGPSGAGQQAWIALATRMGLLYDGEFAL